MDYLLRFSISDKPKKWIINPLVVERMIFRGLIEIRGGSVIAILKILIETFLLLLDMFFYLGYASDRFVSWCILCL